MVQTEWYFEYELHYNRPGVLGEISSLLGMLSINIITINGIENRRRGMLLTTEKESHIKRLRSILQTIDTITVTKLRKSKLRDKLAIRHGKYIHIDEKNRKIVKFVRDELGILVDFMAEIYKNEGHKLIGIRGLPRVGKTESVVAASVCANKRWVFVSSTLLKQTVRERLFAGEYSDQNIYIIDGIVSKRHANENHWQLIHELMGLPTIKVVEHPDIFVQSTRYRLVDFDYIIELRHHEKEEITSDLIEHPAYGLDQDFSMYDY